MAIAKQTLLVKQFKIMQQERSLILSLPFEMRLDKWMSRLIQIILLIELKVTLRLKNQPQFFPTQNNLSKPGPNIMVENMLARLSRQVQVYADVKQLDSRCKCAVIEKKSRVVLVTVIYSCMHTHIDQLGPATIESFTRLHEKQAWTMHNSDLRPMPSPCQDIEAHGPDQLTGRRRPKFRNAPLKIQYFPKNTI